MDGTSVISSPYPEICQCKLPSVNWKTLRQNLSLSSCVHAIIYIYIYTYRVLSDMYVSLTEGWVELAGSCKMPCRQLVLASGVDCFVLSLIGIGGQAGC